jgi:uncharacterized protein
MKVMKMIFQTRRLVVISVFLLALFQQVSIGYAQSIDGNWLAQQIWQRKDGQFVRRQLLMEMTDNNNKTIQRQAELLRWKSTEMKKVLVRFTQPKRVFGTVFLTYDYLDPAQNDEQWMYLPALKKQRRIPASKRGDSFMASDFSYEDIKSELKFPLNDYEFKLLNDQGNDYLLEGIPKTSEIAKQIGYGKFVAAINKNTWLPQHIEFWDTNMQALKKVDILNSANIQGIWTATEIEVTHYQNKHSTKFTYTEVDYPQELDETLFSVAQLGN